jgi:hypothetical protein
MIKFYLYKLNLKIYCYSSCIPVIIIYIIFTLKVFKQNGTDILFTNNYFHNLKNLVIDSMNKTIFKNFINPNEIFMLKWNIGLAIFIYLLITII